MNNDTYKEKAREYLESCGWSYDDEYYDHDVITKIVADFAQQEAMAFAEWTSKKRYIINDEKTLWIHIADIMMKQKFTTAELWELFNKQ